MPILNKDMSVCISLSARPSNLGTRFHNYLYDEIGLNFVYKAFSTTDLEGAVRGMRALGFRGMSVSMPFKEAIIPMVDDLDESARAINSVNTVVNDNGVLTASNTDYEAVAELLERYAVPSGSSVAVRGSGGMAKAVIAAFRGAGFDDLTVVARNEPAGRAIAEQYDYRWEPESTPGADVIINVTPLGMAGGDETTQSFSDAEIDRAATVFDVVAFPSETPLIRAARASDTPVITGAEVIALQAARQFEKYTGVALTREQVERASAFSRQS